MGEESQDSPQPEDEQSSEDSEIDELDEELAQAERGGELLRKLRQAPMWIISAVFHAGILFLTLHITLEEAQQFQEVRKPIEVEVNPEEQKPVDPRELMEVLKDIEEPPEPDVPQNVETPIVEEVPEEVVPLEDTTVVTELVSDEILGMPDILDEDVVSEMPIGSTPRIAVDSGVSKGFKGIYKYRSRGGIKKALRAYGGSKAAYDAVLAGLAWLAQAQESDGRWDMKKWGGTAGDDVGATGLALLAFLGAGHTERDGKYNYVVRRGLSWLIKSQSSSGKLPYRTFYCMGMGAMALSEAYAMGGNPTVGRAAQRAIEFICQQQAKSPSGGFGYGGPGNDMSVTHWQLMAMKSALVAGLRLPPKAISRSKKFLDLSFNANGSSDYRADGNPSNSGSPAVSAAGLMCRQFFGWPRNDPEVLKSAKFIRSIGPHITNLYYLYIGTLAMFQMGSPYWDEWNRKFRDKLISQQIKKGAFRGSWDPDKYTFGKRGGRVYTTAMAILSLEVYYRFLPVYKH